VEELQGRVAVITGGAEGIGRSLALRAADAGMKLVLADIDEASLERTVAELTAKGAEAIGVRVDVADAASVAELAARAMARFGGVHLLVNNAGIASVDPAWEVPLDEWSRVIGVNLLGVVHGIKAFLPAMIASGAPGHVVNVASAAGLVSAPGMGAYCATKSAVVALSESLLHDLQLRKLPIGVSVVCPAWVKTGIASRPQPSIPPGAPGGDAMTQSIRVAIQKAVRSGIPVEDATGIIFDAIRAGRFYVLTHDITRTGVAHRAKDIVEGRPPTLFPFDR
jgi:NAD(P)-dependent dehydrogenase (short-subunit alcohol dehydrogenase family)